MAGYRLTGAAAEDLARIFTESVSVFGRGQADRYYDSLTLQFDFLVDFPRAARVREELRPSVRAFPHQSHIIIYKIDDEEVVTVLRIRHARENWIVDTYSDRDLPS